MEGSAIPECPSLVFFCNRGKMEWTNSSKMLCLVFVYVLYKFVSGLVLWVLGNLWFDDVCRVVGDRLKLVFSPDIILCGWLSSKSN